MKKRERVTILSSWSLFLLRSVDGAFLTARTTLEAFRGEGIELSIDSPHCHRGRLGLTRIMPVVRRIFHSSSALV